MEQKLLNVNANFLICILKTPKPNSCVVQFYVEQHLSIMHRGNNPKQVFLDEW